VGIAVRVGLAVVVGLRVGVRLVVIVGLLIIVGLTVGDSVGVGLAVAITFADPDSEASSRVAAAGVAGVELDAVELVAAVLLVSRRPMPAPTTAINTITNTWTSSVRRFEPPTQPLPQPPAKRIVERLRV
jgi:hypothetical protein